jgi:hypothetical protein
MSSSNEETLANRGTAIPVVQIHPADTPEPQMPNTESDTSHRLSATKLKDKLESLGDKAARDPTSSRMGDKMFNLCVH